MSFAQMWFGPQSNTLNIEFLGLVYFLSGGPSSNAAFYQQESQEKRALNPHMSLSFCLVSQFSISNFWDLYIFSQEGRPATLHSISRNLMRRELSILTWEKLTASTQHPGLTVWLCRSCELWALSNTLNIESSQSSQPGLTVWLCRSCELCSNEVWPSE